MQEDINDLATVLAHTRAVNVLGHSGGAVIALEAARLQVLLVCGAKGPPYYPKIHRALAAAIPRARTLEIPGSQHDGLARANPRIVEPFAEFFAGR